MVLNMYEYRMLLNNYSSIKNYINKNYPIVQFDDKRNMIRLFTINENDFRFSKIPRYINIQDFENINTTQDICYPCRLYNNFFNETEMDFMINFERDEIISDSITGKGDWYEIAIINDPISSPVNKSSFNLFNCFIFVITPIFATGLSFFISIFSIFKI